MYKIEPGAVNSVVIQSYSAVQQPYLQGISFILASLLVGWMQAGMHCSAHTVSGCVNSSIRMHTPCACLAQVLLP